MINIGKLKIGDKMIVEHVDTGKNMEGVIKSMALDDNVVSLTISLPEVKPKKKRR